MTTIRMPCEAGTLHDDKHETCSESDGSDECAGTMDIVLPDGLTADELRSLRWIYGFRRDDGYLFAQQPEGQEFPRVRWLSIDRSERPA